jgi:hypothetical protein
MSDCKTLALFFFPAPREWRKPSAAASTLRHGAPGKSFDGGKSRTKATPNSGRFGC